MTREMLNPRGASNIKRTQRIFSALSLLCENENMAEIECNTGAKSNRDDPWRE
jgi:hypothetical protein